MIIRIVLIQDSQNTTCFSVGFLHQFLLQLPLKFANNKLVGNKGNHNWTCDLN